MLFWLLVVVYVIGVALRTPFSLRNRMLAKYCTRCKSSRFFCNRMWHEEHGHHVVRGSIRERDGVDVAVAFTLASLWPTWTPFLGFRWLTRKTGQLIKRLVFHLTPLTEPELSRRIDEQRAIITALQEHIGAPPSKVIDLVSPERAVEYLEHYRRNGRYPNPVVEYDAQ